MYFDDRYFFCFSMEGEQQDLKNNNNLPTASDVQIGKQAPCLFKKINSGELTKTGKYLSSVACSIAGYDFFSELQAGWC